MRTTMIAKQVLNKKEISDTDLIGELSLKSRQGKELFLGAYESSMPLPTFDIWFEPDMSDEVKSKLLRVDREGEYLLSYYFQNFSHRPFHVKVLERK